MKKYLKKHIFFLFLSMMVLSQSLDAAEESTKISSSLPPALKNFIRELERKKSSRQGGAYALLYKGKVVYKSTFGHKKGTTGPITSKTLFPLASVSKPVTAVGIALLVQSQKIHLDDEMSFPFLQEKVSLRQILSHTTGVPLRGDHHIEQKLSRPALFAKIKEQKPFCSVGKGYFYSNLLFDLIQESLAHQGYSLQSVISVLQKTLGTREICLSPWEYSQDIAYPHSQRKGKKGTHFTPLPLPYIYARAVPTAAGIFGSLDGMIKFLQLASGYRPHLLSPQVLKTVQTPLIKSSDAYRWTWPFPKKTLSAQYGLGWRILKTTTSPQKALICHSGGLAGISTFVGYIPSQEVGFIALHNQKKSAHKAGIKFWEAFL